MRIEDLDASRSRASYASMIMADFEALGLIWDKGPYYQSNRTADYENAFGVVSQQARVYPCFCSRADIQAQSAPHTTSAYPGTCRNLTDEEVENRFARFAREGREEAWRLASFHEPFAFDDLFQGAMHFDLADTCGDIILRRGPAAHAYNLAVVVDDAEQGIDVVVRGADLLETTPVQMHLQNLLGYRHPTYAHVPVLMAPDGSRIAKRHDAAGLDRMLAEWGSHRAVLGHIAHATGIVDEYQPLSADDLLASARLEKLEGKRQIAWPYA